MEWKYKVAENRTPQVKYKYLKIVLEYNSWMNEQMKAWSDLPRELSNVSAPFLLSWLASVLPCRACFSVLTHSSISASLSAARKWL